MVTAFDIHDEAFRESPVGILARAGIDPADCKLALDFRGANATRRLKDKSFNGNDGTNYGTTLANGSATFNGGEWVSHGNIAALDSADVVSIAFASRNCSAGGIVISKHYENFEVRLNASMFDGYVGDGTGWKQLLSGDVAHNASLDAFNTWCYVFNFGGSVVQFYANGVYKGNYSPANMGHVVTGLSVYMGRRVGGSLYLSGTIPALSIFTSLPTATQITKLHQILSARYA